MNLKGRVVFITGGAGHLGKAYCEALAELGADIAIADRNIEAASAVCDDLAKRYGIRAKGVACELTKPEDVRRALAETKDAFGRLDILINNAYAGNKNRFETITYEEWQANIDIGLNAVFYTVREAFDLLKETRGVVLNTASMYGHIAPDYKLYEGNEHAVPAS